MRPPEFMVKQGEATAALAKYDEMRAKLLGGIRSLEAEVYAATDLPPEETRIHDLTYSLVQARMRARAVAMALESEIMAIHEQVFEIHNAFLHAKLEDVAFLKHCLDRGM